MKKTIYVSCNGWEYVMEVLVETEENMIKIDDYKIQIGKTTMTFEEPVVISEKELFEIMRED